MGRIKNLIRNINYLSKHSLWDQRENDIVYLSKKILDDAQVEFGLKPDDNEIRILGVEESVELVKKSNKSFVRFNDGEINLMKGCNQPFQKYDEELVRCLYEILETNDDNLIVGLNRDYYVPLYNSDSIDYYRRYAYDFRKFFGEHCLKDRNYIDASFTFYRFGDYSSDAEKFWEKWKEMFRGRKLAIICGEGILDKLQFDIFDLCSERIYIYGPKRHAWSKHKEIIAEIVEKVSKETTLVFILGMAGKAMIPETTKLGYVSWDIGHLAKGYDAYMRKILPTQEFINDFFAPD